MAKYLNGFPKNLTEYPNSFKRQGAFPLEMYSVFTSLDAAKAYAENPNSVAYVGQPIAVVEDKSEIKIDYAIVETPSYTNNLPSYFEIDQDGCYLWDNEWQAVSLSYNVIGPLGEGEITIRFEGEYEHKYDPIMSPNRTNVEELENVVLLTREQVEAIQREMATANQFGDISRAYSVYTDEKLITTYYIISDTAGTLVELGTAGNIDGLDARLKEVEKFFESTDNLNQTIDTLYELQEFIKEHGQDFSALHKDVKDIYTPPFPENPVSGTPAKPESGYLVDKEKQLRSEIENIYKKGVGENPSTGKLPDETQERILADITLGERIDEIYDADGGLAEDGVTKIPDGLLVEETNNRIAADAAEAKAREEADAKIYEDLLGSDPRKADTEFNGVTGILAGIRGNKVDGKYQYNNIIEYIQNEIPIATENRLGRVLSSQEKDQVAVDEYGRMTVNSLNVNKLYQTEYLIIDGGTATPVAFTPKEEEPTIEEV